MILHFRAFPADVKIADMQKGDMDRYVVHLLHGWNVQSTRTFVTPTVWHLRSRQKIALLHRVFDLGGLQMIIGLPRWAKEISAFI